MRFDTKQYWEERLSRQFDLSATGTLGFSRRYIQFLYKLKEHAVSQSIRANRINITGQSILDIGSGTGFFIDFYSRFKPATIVGLDITQVSVDRLSRRYPSHTFIQADMGEPFDLGRTFDIINGQDVFYHIVDDERFAQAMRNLDQLSHRGTALLFSEVFEPETIGGAPHAKFRSRSIYEEALGQIGFRILEVRPIYCLMNLPLPYVPAHLLDAAAPLLFVVDRILLPMGFRRKNNTKLITCQKIV
ncbi:MAG: class I SAM-dependent methyltransferase [Acidobacteria bacterium]|nr:class I SAM-dependent methyltransferase [Acidobacteriota bacterium]